jgi:hypothetical protein
MKAIPLRPITRHYATTLRTRGLAAGTPLRRECWEAVTTDGEWAFERIEEPGTPWIVVHHPHASAAETCFGFHGTLKRAREALERGWVRPPSHYRTEHEAALHTRDQYACPACAERRWAR